MRIVSLAKIRALTTTNKTTSPVDTAQMIQLELFEGLSAVSIAEILGEDIENSVLTGNEIEISTINLFT